MKFLAIFVLAFSSLVAVGQSTDIFIMPGSDFIRPGLLPRANLNIGIGHSLAKLSKSYIGQEITFAYTYENAGTHGFWHTEYGSHTEALGIMKNFSLPGTKVVSGYTWHQSGITSLTGSGKVQNRAYTGDSLGAVIHLKNTSKNLYNSIWIQETYSKINTIPWYTTFGIGYTVSF